MLFSSENACNGRWDDPIAKKPAGISLENEKPSLDNLHLFEIKNVKRWVSFMGYANMA